MNRFDQTIVNNLRLQCGDTIIEFTDEQVIKGWKEFALSNEYPDMSKFPDWCRPPETTA